MESRVPRPRRSQQHREDAAASGLHRSRSRSRERRREGERNSEESDGGRRRDVDPTEDSPLLIEVENAPEDETSATGAGKEAEEMKEIMEWKLHVGRRDKAQPCVVSPGCFTGGQHETVVPHVVPHVVCQSGKLVKAAQAGVLEQGDVVSMHGMLNSEEEEKKLLNVTAAVMAEKALTAAGEQDVFAPYVDDTKSKVVKYSILNWGIMDPGDSPAVYASRVAFFINERNEIMKELKKWRNEYVTLKKHAEVVPKSKKFSLSLKTEKMEEEIFALEEKKEVIEKNGGPFLEKWSNEQRFLQMGAGLKIKQNVMEKGDAKGKNKMVTGNIQRKVEPAGNVKMEMEKKMEVNIKNVGKENNDIPSDDSLKAGQNRRSDSFSEDEEDEEVGAGFLMAEIRKIESPIRNQLYFDGDEVPDTPMKKKKKKKVVGEEVVFKYVAIKPDNVNTQTSEVESGSVKLGRKLFCKEMEVNVASVSDNVGGKGKKEVKGPDSVAEKVKDGLGEESGCVAEKVPVKESKKILDKSQEVRDGAGLLGKEKNIFKKNVLKNVSENIVLGEKKNIKQCPTSQEKVDGTGKKVMGSDDEGKSGKDGSDSESMDCAFEHQVDTEVEIECEEKEKNEDKNVPVRSYASVVSSGVADEDTVGASGDNIVQQQLLRGLREGKDSVSVEGRQVDLSFWKERHGLSAFKEKRKGEAFWFHPTVGGGSRRNVVRLRWRGSETCPARNKVVELLLGMGFSAGDIYALIHPYGTAMFDVSFVSPQGLELFWSRYELAEGNPTWKEYEVVPITRQNTTKRVTVLTSNESLSEVDIMTWLSRYGEVGTFPFKVLDQYGIWSGAWTFQVKLRVQGNSVTHIPSSAFIGRDRIMVFYQGQPKLCHKCGSPTHFSAQCTVRRCAMCGDPGHLAASCAEIRCNLCGKMGHPFSRCPSAFANSSRRQAGEGRGASSEAGPEVAGTSPAEEGKDVGEGTNLGSGKTGKKLPPSKIRRQERRQKEREKEQVGEDTPVLEQGETLAAESPEGSELNVETLKPSREATSSVAVSSSAGESLDEDCKQWLEGRRNKRSKKKRDLVKSRPSLEWDPSVPLTLEQMPKEGSTGSPLIVLSNRFRKLVDVSSSSSDESEGGEGVLASEGASSGAAATSSLVVKASGGEVTPEAPGNEKKVSMDVSVCLKRQKKESDVSEDGLDGSGKKGKAV